MPPPLPSQGVSLQPYEPWERLAFQSSCQHPLRMCQTFSQSFYFLLQGCKLLVISSSSKIASFSMTLGKKFGIAFSLTKACSLFGPQVPCLSDNLILNPLVPYLMVHISFSKSSWRREKNCLTGILRSCQFERH